MDDNEIVLIKAQLTCHYCGKFCNEPVECKICSCNYCTYCAQFVKICLSESCQKVNNKLETKSNEAIKRMIKNNEFPPICEFCEKQFNNYNEYEDHLVNCPHHFFFCKVCQNKFSDNKKFVHHLLNEHFDNVSKELIDNS